MITLDIRHKTTYRYREPVFLGTHRLMLRPRESRDVRLISSRLQTSPPATLDWAHDVFGNTRALATLGVMSDVLVIESVCEIELYGAQWPVFDIALAAQTYPFRYTDDDWIDLGALTALQYPDPGGQLHDWASAIVRSKPTDTISLLEDLNRTVFEQINYQSREDEGTQSPIETLDRGWGACRDLAVLFAEAVRSLGMAARIVSGYFYDPNPGLGFSPGPASTHAWVEVYVPGAGWIPFDPTNRGIGVGNLVPVAVGRNIRQTMPVAGSFTGSTNAFKDMSVDVSVTARSSC